MITNAIVADTLTIGTTGVRCFIGNISLACAANTRPMTLGDPHMWTATQSLTTPQTLEPGFQPGQPVDPTQLVIGDLALIGGQIGVISQIGTQPQVHLDNRELDIASISTGRNDFGGFFHPNPGPQLNPDQPMSIRDWTFTLNGNTLTISSPNGTTNIDTLVGHGSRQRRQRG